MIPQLDSSMNGWYPSHKVKLCGRMTVLTCSWSYSQEGCIMWTGVISENKSYLVCCMFLTIITQSFTWLLYMVFLLPLICFNLYLLEPPVNTRYKKLCRGGVFSKINEVLLPSLLITCLQDPGFANIAEEFKYITLINVNTKRRVPTPAFRNRKILQCTYLAERSS